MRTVFINLDRRFGRLPRELESVVQRAESKDETFALREAPLPRKRVHAQTGACRIGAVSAEDVADEVFWPEGIVINVRRHEFRPRRLTPSQP
jgi:hypothetical protein